MPPICTANVLTHALAGRWFPVPDGHKPAGGGGHWGLLPHARWKLYPLHPGLQPTGPLRWPIGLLRGSLFSCSQMQHVFWWFVHSTCLRCQGQGETAYIIRFWVLIWMAHLYLSRQRRGMGRRWMQMRQLRCLGRMMCTPCLRCGRGHLSSLPAT